MKKGNIFFNYLILFICFCTIYSCVKSDDFDTPDIICNDNLTVTKTVSDIFNIATTTATKYAFDDVIEGYIVSSDQNGNFFKNIAVQTLDGSLGFNIPIDQTDLYTIYNPGRKVSIKLQNKYIKISNDALQIGSLFIDNFNNQTVGRIQYPDFKEVVVKSCENINEEDLVNHISIDNLSDNYLNTLVEFTNVQFTDDALGTTLYDSNNDLGGSATNHLIQNNTGASLILRTSAFADFANISVPSNSGTIRGVLTKFKDDYQLLIRSIADLRLDNDRFNIELKNKLFFTEIADPNNNSNARFIEIYNSENQPVNLNGWTIRRYTNANTSVSSTINLSGKLINAGQAFIIAVNATEFETVFGFAPDFEGSANGPADSNGDDQLELVDPLGTVVDIFGVIGEDGSGTNHEFEDGRANRKISVIQGNTIYTFAEWDVWNDTGDAGTINEPQDAPGNFTPGVR